MPARKPPVKKPSPKPKAAGGRALPRNGPSVARKPSVSAPAERSANGAERLAVIHRLIDAERRHDLPGILACFGPEPTLEFAGGPRHAGAERVGQIYGDLLRAFPDLTLDLTGEHVAAGSVVVEMVMRGTHRQQWLGMAPRGRSLALPVCSVFLFDKRDQLQAQRIYLDRNLAIVQLTSGLLR